MACLANVLKKCKKKWAIFIFISSAYTHTIYVDVGEGDKAKKRKSEIIQHQILSNYLPFCSATGPSREPELDAAECERDKHLL